MKFEEFKVGAIIGGAGQLDYLVVETNEQDKQITVVCTTRLHEPIIVDEEEFSGYRDLGMNAVHGEKTLLDTFAARKKELEEWEKKYKNWKETFYHTAT